MRTGLGVVVLPPVPRAHQRVLQDRQLVGVVADVVEQALHEARRDAPAAHADRTGDRRLHSSRVRRGVRYWLSLIASGSPANLCAVPEEVGAHGEHDVHRHVGLLRGREQQLHEGLGLVVGPASALGEVREAEDLLELVDEDQHVLVRFEPGQPHHLDQAQAAAAQRRLDDALGRLLRESEVRELRPPRPARERGTGSGRSAGASSPSASGRRPRP